METAGRFLTMISTGGALASMWVFLLFPTDIGKALSAGWIALWLIGMAVWGIGLYARKAK